MVVGKARDVLVLVAIAASGHNVKQREVALRILGSAMFTLGIC